MKTIIEWIPVERELPPDDKMLLGATCRGEIRLGWLWGGKWCCLIGDNNITHWAHLPEHPQGLSKELKGD